MIKTIKLDEKRWKGYKGLRLEALRSDPLAFGSSYEEEIKLSESEWRRRIKNALFAVDGDTPVGMIVCIFENKIKTKHIANIYGLYVKNEYRSQKIGTILFKMALKFIQGNSNIQKIKLSVNTIQEHAVKIYEKHGFKKVGIHKKELKIDDKFYDELIMEKLL